MAKGKLKKGLDKLKGKAKNIGAHIVEGQKNLAKGITAGALLPFAPFMKMAVEKKGAKPERKIIPLAKQFIELVVKKDGGNAYEMAYYEMLTQQNLENFENVEDYEEHLAEDIVSIVKLVVEWIKKIKAKKEAGKELSPAEAAALKESELIDDTKKKLNESKIDDEASTGGGFKNISKKFDTKTIGILAVVVVGFLVISKK